MSCLVMLAMKCKTANTVCNEAEFNHNSLVIVFIFCCAHAQTCVASGYKLAVKDFSRV